MEPEKPAFAISVPSEDPKKADKQADGSDKPEASSSSTTTKAGADGKAEPPTGDELVRPLASSPDWRKRPSLTCLCSVFAPARSRRRTSSSRASSRCSSSA